MNAIVYSKPIERNVSPSTERTTDVKGLDTHDRLLSSRWVPGTATYRWQGTSRVRTVGGHWPTWRNSSVRTFRRPTTRAFWSKRQAGARRRSKRTSRERARARLNANVVDRGSGCGTKCGTTDALSWPPVSSQK